jgi:hypothetical protein
MCFAANNRPGRKVETPKWQFTRDFRNNTQDSVSTEEPHE